MTETLPQKILILMPNWIGDAVMATPLLGQICARYPTSEIAILAKPWIAELLTHHPAIHRIIVYEARGRHTGISGISEISSFLRLIKIIRSQLFDLAILLPNSFKSALIAAVAGIPKRVGYRADGRSLFLTQSLSRKDAPLHQREAYLSLMDRMGGRLPGLSPIPFLQVTDAERESAKDLLKLYRLNLSDCLVGLCPGGSYGSAKQWSPHSYAKVADQLIARFGAQIIILGHQKERKIAGHICAAMTNHPIMLTGQTSVRMMMAILSHCHLVITNDSGPMHIAAALGRPMVSLFGPTLPIASAPLGSPNRLLWHKAACAPCAYRDCPIDHRCMTAMTPEAVFNAAVQQLAGPSKQTAVFLDRDGTITEDTGYPDSIQKLRLFSTAAEAISKLNHAGILVIVVTNQSGVARGLFDEAFVHQAHRHLQNLLLQGGARLDGIYYCPHDPDAGCICRKPAMGMIEKALLDHPIDFSRSYVVGDKMCDVELVEGGKGGQGILVKTGQGRRSFETLAHAKKRPAFVAEDLLSAVHWILRDIEEQKEKGIFRGAQK